MQSNEEEDFDITLIDENIYKLWNQISSKPNVDDIEQVELEKTELSQPMTTRNEILGWIMFDWANSPQWQVMQGLVWTLFVTQTATQCACDQHMQYGCDVDNNPIDSNETVRIEIGSISLKPESFFFFVLSISGIMQLISYVMIGGLMDYRAYQYYIFRFCAVMAALFNAPYIFFSSPNTYMFAGWWTAVGIVFFGLSNIAYNSHLVDIVDNHWLVRRAQRRNNCPSLYVCQIKNRIMDDLSIFGYGCGYTASLIMTLIMAVILFIFADSTSVQLLDYGITTGLQVNVVEEMYAKNVYGCSINSFYDTNTTMSYITSIQLFYDDINLNGSIIGSNNGNQNIFHSEYAINSVLLWYNSDESIAAIQFETVNTQTKSQMFGYVEVNEMNDFVTVNSDDFVLGGYNVYSMQNYVSGFDFLFYKNGNQWPSTLGMRLVIFTVFLWWFGWQLFTLCTMKKRIKSDIPSDSFIWAISAKNTWNILTDTFRNYKYIRNILIAWFFYSDALNSLMVSSVLFASIDLGFTNLDLAVMLLEYEIGAAVGNVFHLQMQKKLQWNCKQMVVYHLIFYCIFPWYIAIGLIPNAPFGLVSKWELWVFTLFFATHMGSIQGFGRALISNLIPVGKENKIFSLYAITDKGSSWIGPLVMGFFADKVGLRWGMSYILAMLLISLPFVWNIDLIEGMKQAGKLNEHEEKEENEATVRPTEPLASDTELNEVALETELQEYVKT